MIVPNITVTRSLRNQNEWVRTFLKRFKRTQNTTADHPTGFHSFVWWFLPWLGVSKLEKTLVNVSAVIEQIENYTVDAIQALELEITSLSKKVLQNRMALDILLAAQGEVCTVINVSCCVYINQERKIATDLNEM